MNGKERGEIRYFSMFTGVGGFELGFEKASIQRDKESRTDSTMSNRESSTQGRSKPTFNCIGMSESNKYSSQILKYKFPTIKNWGNCKKINPTELPDFDMLCGGFPCQSFSIAGKRRGFQDTRGTMFFEIARILKIKRPNLVLLENVKGLLNHDEGKTFSVILESLDELGYETQWMVLNSKFFGVPQNRERVFIIGSLRGTSRPEILPFGFNCEQTNGVYGKSEEVANTINTSIGRNQSDGQYITHPTITEAIGRQGSSKEYINSLRQIRAVHNIYGGFGEGARFSDISPTIRTPKGGGHLPMILQTLKEDGLEPTKKGWKSLNKIRAVLTPDRPEKRQNGRRFKEEGEPSFTLTGQDIHGVAIAQPAQMVNINRAKKPYNPNDRKMKIKVRDDETSYTVKSAAHEFMVEQNTQIRRLTPVECCRLQGFPDDWNEWGIDENGVKVRMSDTQRYKQMGNAVTTNVVAAVGSKLGEGF